MRSLLIMITFIAAFCKCCSRGREKGILHEREYTSPDSQRRKKLLVCVNSSTGHRRVHCGPLSTIPQDCPRNLLRWTKIESKREYRTSTTEPTQTAWIAAQWQYIQFCELADREQGSPPQLHKNSLTLRCQLLSRGKERSFWSWNASERQNP